MTRRIPNQSQVPAAAIPPITDADVHGIANMIVTRYSDDALRFAAQQMEHFRRCGDHKEHAIWARIGMAVGTQESAPAQAVAA